MKAASPFAYSYNSKRLQPFDSQLLVIRHELALYSVRTLSQFVLNCDKVWTRLRDHSCEPAYTHIYALFREKGNCSLPIHTAILQSVKKVDLSVNRIITIWRNRPTFAVSKKKTMKNDEPIWVSASKKKQ